MKRKHRKKSRQRFEKIASVLSLLLLLLSWFAGGWRLDAIQESRFQHLLLEGESLQPLNESIYQGVTRAGDPVEWITQGVGVGYGGPLTIGLTISEGMIDKITLLSSSETPSYLDKVLSQRLLEPLAGQPVQRLLEVDGVSGATLTSQGLIRAVNQAADPVRVKLYGESLTEADSALFHLQWLDAAALILFLMALWVSKTHHPKKTVFNRGILLASTVLFGFYASALYSTATMGILISGAWLSGLGNYTALILLLLSVASILQSNRNLYCEHLCPFGAAQRCLAGITNARAVNLKHPLFVWIPRVILLAALCLGLFFHNPASFSYEPFGILFSMIGTLYLFALTVLILLTSLFIRRPWCKSLCPVHAMTDFLTFNRQWFKQVRKDLSKRKIREKHHA